MSSLLRIPRRRSRTLVPVVDIVKPGVNDDEDNNNNNNNNKGTVLRGGERDD